MVIRLADDSGDGGGISRLVAVVLGDVSREKKISPSPSPLLGRTVEIMREISERVGHLTCLVGELWQQ